MPARLRLKDVRFSDLPRVIGLCADDVTGVAQAVNGCQSRLLNCREAGEEGWWGTFAEMAFTLTRSQPYLTLPRDVARLEVTTVCNCPTPVQNQFYEYLQFGNGRMPQPPGFASPLRPVQAFTRNNVVTFVDPPPGLFTIQIFTTDPADVDAAKRVLVSGRDLNGQIIYSQDVEDLVRGIYYTVDEPFISGPQQFSSLDGVQKDYTAGQIQIFAVDASGNATMILTMEPGETAANYRRYYFDRLPTTCCANIPPCPPTPPSPVLITAIAKLDLIPAWVDSDYLLIQSIDALIEEAQARRLSFIDSKEAKEMSAYHHKQAVNFLIGQLRHYLGEHDAAINFKPFGSASLRKVRVGMT